MLSGVQVCIPPVLTNTGSDPRDSGTVSGENEKLATGTARRTRKKNAARRYIGIHMVESAVNCSTEV
jgi:hypothetical protein